MLSSGQVLAAAEDDAKAAFSRFVAARNAHDVSAARDSLLDSPGLLWVTRGTPIWGSDAALMRFEVLSRVHRNHPAGFDLR